MRCGLSTEEKILGLVYVASTIKTTPSPTIWFF